MPSFASTSSSIKVLPVQNVGFPTAFSPNGDGLNDYFELNGGPVRTLNLSIYNRWGEKVYQTTDAHLEGWDGRFKGEPQPSGIYIYYLEIEFLDSRRITKTSELNLIR